MCEDPSEIQYPITFLYFVGFSDFKYKCNPRLYRYKTIEYMSFLLIPHIPPIRSLYLLYTMYMYKCT